MKKLTDHQDDLITQLNDRVSTLEYILAQTLSIALQENPDKVSILRDMQTFYAEKMLQNGVSADSGNKGFETAERIFTAVAATN
jgi:hypothetical protein